MVCCSVPARAPEAPPVRCRRAPKAPVRVRLTTAARPGVARCPRARRTTMTSCCRSSTASRPLRCARGTRAAPPPSRWRHPPRVRGHEHCTRTPPTRVAPLHPPALRPPRLTARQFNHPRSPPQRSSPPPPVPQASAKSSASIPEHIPENIQAHASTPVDAGAGVLFLGLAPAPAPRSEPRPLAAIKSACMQGWGRLPGHLRLGRRRAKGPHAHTHTRWCVQCDLTPAGAATCTAGADSRQGTPDQHRNKIIKLQPPSFSTVRRC